MTRRLRQLVFAGLTLCGAGGHARVADCVPLGAVPEGAILKYWHCESRTRDCFPAAHG